MTANQSDTTNNVDCTTLDKKLMMGYQGWFGCIGDGSEAKWWHWSLDNSVPNSSNLTVDMWPDTSEFTENDKFQTNLTDSNGPASLYSAYRSSVVDLHFKWMQKYQLDGVMLQRFVSELTPKNGWKKIFRDKVTSNVRTSAKTYGRAFCIMYDITGSSEDTFVQDLIDDWASLVDNGVTDSPPYLKHNDKPLLAIWGLGFKDSPGRNDHPGTASQATDIVTYFKNEAKVTLLGGVPTNWRTPGSPGGDSKPNSDPSAQPGDPTWLGVYKSFNVLSPWSVNRYSYDRSPTKMGADDFNNNIISPDLTELLGSEVEYMPVVFPGYSTKNQGRADPNRILNEVPRLGGRFWWRQLYNAVDLAKCTKIYGAMFDEVNEGTAMFKLVADPQDLPTQAQLVPINVVGESPRNLKSDYYLWLAGETNRRLRNGVKFTLNMPTLDQPTPLPNWF